jgi:copper homeostasis protein
MLEIIASTVEEAILIEKCGADRIELVSALSEGGLTPSYGLIEHVVKSVSIPVNVMVRPHSQNFVYSDYSINCMIKDIEIIKQLKANGIVIGVLDKNNNVDIPVMEKLLKHCKGLEVTFHRAIDECQDILSEVKKITKLNHISRILTSGGSGKAIDNLNKICEINKTLENTNIKILVGSGVTLENFSLIFEKIGLNEIHIGTNVRENFSSLNSIEEEKLKNFVEKFKDYKKSFYQQS